MVDLLLMLTIAMGLYLAWSVGANTFGSTIGINLGSTNISKTSAILFSSIAAILGIILLSNRIVDTIAKEFVGNLQFEGLISVLIAIVVISTIITYKGIPISTTYAIIGALTGYALTSAAGINLEILGKIQLSLFLSPFGALVIAFVISYIVKKIFLHNGAGIQKMESFEMKFFLPGFIALMLLAFGLGANSVGIVMGLLGGKLSFPFLILIGSAGLVLGVVTLGSRTAHTLGIELADLSPSKGFIAMLAAGLTMIGFVATGIPISTTQTLIGAVVGAGLARKGVNVKQALKVTGTWLIVLPAALTIISMVFSAAIGRVI